MSIRKPASFALFPALICALAVSFMAPTAFADPAALTKILAGDHRSDANRARDVYRHPVETLGFFGVKADSNVIEIYPGGGWYTEILAPYVRENGRYFGTIVTPRGMKSFQDKLATKPAIYDKVKILSMANPGALDIRPEGGADFVLTFRNVHNWLDDDLVDAYMKSFFDALKPGGVLGVVEHRAKPGTKLKQSIDTGYVTEEFVIKHAQMAGFKLDAKSEINANAKDTKDYKDGVWTLPPVLTLKEKDREKYLAIGESDRMTLRFVKPAK
jgi:predicted methyltransferase